MKLATHQPYFFPYLGYFSLISAVDKFVFFDKVQFHRRSWMTRNRILKPNLNEFQFITAGIEKPPFNASFTECKLSFDQKWKIKLMAQLEHYKKKAPFYEETLHFLNHLFEEKDDLLVSFNIRTTKSIARLLKIETSFLQYSEIEDRVEKDLSGGYWGLNFCKTVGADTYINAPDGETFYPKDAFTEAGIKLGFIQHKLNPYLQFNQNFVPGLSVIDVLMFNGAEKTAEMVNEFSIKWINE